jgi:hypothetical protein
MWYAFDTAAGNSVSLKPRVWIEADQKVNAMNETERQPAINLGLAKVYLNGADPKLATRTIPMPDHSTERYTHSQLVPKARAVSRHDSRRAQRERKPIMAIVTGRLPALQGRCSTITPCSGHWTRRAA